MIVERWQMSSVQKFITGASLLIGASVAASASERALDHKPTVLGGTPKYLFTFAAMVGGGIGIAFILQSVCGR